MDMHAAAHPDIEPGTVGMSARLPGEAHEPTDPVGDLEAGERLPSSVAKPSRRRRKVLLAGVAVGAVALAGGAFFVSPYNTLYPVPRLQASVNNTATNAQRYAQTALRPLLAPSASLAKIAIPPAPPATRNAFMPKPRDQQVAELLALHPAAAGQGDAGARSGDADGRPAERPSGHPAAKAAPAAPAAAAAADAPSDYVPREPGSFSAAQPTAAPVPLSSASAVGHAAPSAAPPKDATALAIASLSQAASPPVSDVPAAPPVASAPAPAQVPQLLEARSADVPLPVPPAMRPRDTLSEATNLRAGPMSPPEQVQVLNLVTEMAAMVKDLRKQQAQLRADLGRSSAEVTGRLTDYERRLAFAEARGAVNAADDVTGNASPRSVELGSDVAAAPMRPIPVMATRPVAVVSSSLVASAPKAYRVQAASPGLALLAQVDRGGGDGAQMQVVVGDAVPDYGRVKSIAQKGTTWVVTTERGAIQ